MTAPKRIQQRRTKGWRMPEGAVSVARPSRWGNPYVVGDPTPLWRRSGLGWPDRYDRATAVEAHRLWLAERPDLVADIRAELAGKDVACWCPLDAECHADTLRRVAAGGEP